MDNKDITTITTSGTGDGYGGKFKVLYPAAAVAGKDRQRPAFFYH